MKKSVFKRSDSNGGGKQSFSSAAELVRRLDEALKRAETVPDVFSVTNNALRLRLRELCEQSLLADSEETCRRAEDTLWRKVYYESYTRAKQLTETLPLGAYGSSLLARHLLAGLGSYQQLLLSLRAQLGVTAAGSMDLALCEPTGMTRGTVSSPASETRADAPAWGVAVLQRILTSLGDLSRYLSDLRPAEYPATLTTRYYSQAVVLSPSAGRPHNQLGTLAGGAHHGLQAAYHYLRCMTSHDSFDGGRLNLRRLLEKNHTRRVELEMEHGNSEVPARRRLIITFLDVVYGATLLEAAKQHRFVRLCQETLQWFSFCLHPAPADGGLVSINGQPVGEVVQPRTVLLMVVIVILALQTLREDAAPASGLRALLLAVFSTLVRCVTSRLSTRFPNLTTNSEPPPAAAPIVDSEKKRRRRGQRRAPAQLIHDDSDEEDEPAPGLSESESEAGSDSDESRHSSSDSDPEWGGEPGDGRPSPAELVSALREQGLLVPLRICCDWLRANEEVVRSCRESGADLWRQLVTLVNAASVELTGDAPVDGLRAEFVRQLRAGEALLAQSTPLWEDRLLRGVDLLATRHQHMDWTEPLRQSVTQAEQAVLRVRLLTEFASWLTTVPGLGVTQTDGRFSHISSDANGKLNNNNNITEEEPPAEEPSGERRRQLMSTMAEQWLRSEVRSLRSRTRAGRAGQASFSPYVVVDTSSLVTYLESLKQMVKARQFVVVVPSAVIHELDERKATCSAAREASRWLEIQFRRGNRFLRPQRANEKASLHLVKYPRRKQRDQWHFFQILECCSHLSQSVPAAGASSPTPVTLLVGSATAADFSPRGLASAAGIHLELITAFHSKWAVSSKGRS